MRLFQPWFFAGVVALAVPVIAAGCAGSNPAPQTGDSPSTQSTSTSEKTSSPKPAETSNKATAPDMEMTDKQLKRGTRQADHCGGVSEKGPFGKAVVHVTVKPNGDVDATTDAPFAGTPIGECLQHSFDREKVPPWNGEPHKRDITIEVKKSADVIGDLPAASASAAKPPKK